MTDWGTAAISGEFGGAEQGYGVAQGKLAAAADHAQRAEAKVAAGGLRGVAAGLAQIRAKIEQDQAQVGGAQGGMPPLAEAVNKITDEATPDQVTAALTPVAEGVDKVVTATMQAKQAIHQTEAMVRRNLAGGRPEQLLAHLGPAASTLDAIRQRLDKAKTATQASLRLAREAGDSEGRPQG